MICLIILFKYRRLLYLKIELNSSLNRTWSVFYSYKTLGAD